MKCYSYQCSDFEKHYQELAKRFHILCGIDDPSFKQVFLNSIPKDLAYETFRLIKFKTTQIPHLSLGEIY